MTLLGMFLTHNYTDRVTEPREGSIVHTHNPRVLTPQNGVSTWGRLILVLYIL